MPYRWFAAQLARMTEPTASMTAAANPLPLAKATHLILARAERGAFRSVPPEMTQPDVAGTQPLDRSSLHQRNSEGSVAD